MDHNSIRHRLSEYLDGAISDSEKTEIEDHLKTCTPCGNALMELRKTIEHVKTVEEIEPPAWMAAKIMAKVYEDAARKQGLFERILLLFSSKFPIQAMAMVFLAVTAFFTYRSIQPNSVPTEAPVQEFGARKEAVQKNLARPDDRAPRAKLPPQSPAYKALDMKFAYEPPPPPVALGKTMAPSPASERTEDLGESSMNDARAEKRALPAREQAAPAAGVAMTDETKPGIAATSDKPKAGEMETGPITTGKEGTTTPPNTQVPRDILMDLGEYFTNHNLPKEMMVSGIYFKTHKILLNAPLPEWVDDSAKKAMQSCRNAYHIDVRLAEKKQQYLYCTDEGIIRFLGMYEQRGGKWDKVQ